MTSNTSPKRREVEKNATPWCTRTARLRHVNAVSIDGVWIAGAYLYTVLGRGHFATMTLPTE